MTFAAIEDFASVVSKRISVERILLAGRWLHRLKDILTVQPNQVFPSQQLLDHIPVLIGEIAGYLYAPEEEEIAANTAVIEKARELGMLRHQQQASVHQVLREYEILDEILESFVVEETQRLGLAPTPAECFEICQRLTRASRTLMRTTIDTFISEYTSTIQERTERINRLNRMAGHEMRAPISTLLFGASVLEMESVKTDPERVTRIAQSIRSNAERLSASVDHLQRLARLAEPLDVPTEQRVEVSTVAQEVARQLAEMAAARDVTLRVADGLPELVADPAQIELLFLNLVSNGIKYSDERKPERFVEIGPLESEAEAGTCTLVVRDNGLGIPPCDQPTIFERDDRANPDGSPGMAGSGLGLAIAAECVQSLGGTIRCESVVDQGTSFYVTLPCETQGSRAPTLRPAAN